MKKTSIANFYGTKKQNISNRTKREKKNANKKPNIRQEVEFSKGSNGRGIIQPLLCALPKDNDQALPESINSQQG
ncbi:MAG: hypothetical protein B6D44_15135 [Ignavibacteriales bacterium UTCHB2]|jgi:hypothetical protein|nr:MAG: hypothetical protein B6D44_15135 [Ignavibacteriales bacterium UTCHB2]